ncbi:C40 family peptidase [Marinoscillum sp.]|uniref:C40 family peptidase n=1 Tax=Marinoscillum sp. TaxID=2024838 RepID=UPI003BA94B0B
MNSTFIKTFLIISFSLLMVGNISAQNRKKTKKIDRVIAEGRRYIGTPYRYGGMSKSGIDCSGLIYNCYKTIDVNLPRTAKDQSKIGSSKTWDSIRPGDIVYFKFKQKGEKWYHAGMITHAEKDDIRFVHASTRSGVIESSLLDSYYMNNVKKFRRVIK